MVLRKREEIRLSLWVEQQMQERFGSKRRAKEEILARYASFVYMGKGQYGFAQASEYYLGRPLTTLTAADAGQAALLAGIAKSPRDYAPLRADAAAGPAPAEPDLALMAADGFISRDQMTTARPAAAAGPWSRRRRRPLGVVGRRRPRPRRTQRPNDPDLGLEDLLQGASGGFDRGCSCAAPRERRAAAGAGNATSCGIQSVAGSRRAPSSS